ncbi:MAG: murein transglycosylase A, partial [Terriglobales bacterium]
MTHIVRAFAPVFVPLLSAILALAGCSELPPVAAPANSRACPACAECPACGAPERPAGAKYQRVPFAAIPGWASAPLAPGLRAFTAGCGRIAAGPLRRACEAGSELRPDDEAGARRFLEATFEAWSIASTEGASEGLVTGYYEPVLAGSRTRSERYRVPVYGVPADLVAVELESVNPELKGLRLRGRIQGNRLVPYWTRAEIEGRDGSGAPVVAWVEDPVELFFLQIQGSGQIELDSGERLRLAYGEQNGHPYRSMGRFLIQRGELSLEQSSMHGIKAWAAANPRKLREALDANPSYVFFRESPLAVARPGSASGPLGTLGAALTAGYSIAVDQRYVPLGAPVFLATTWPLSTQPLERLMAAQDTGGAIRGAVRADLYWGSGSEAGTLAGRMRQRGRMWILWPRGET